LERIKPFSVHVGNFLKTPSSSIQLVATGIAVVDGWYVITNSHSFARPLDAEKKEAVIVQVFKDGESQPREAE
jgi:hypothetical protein